MEYTYKTFINIKLEVARKILAETETQQRETFLAHTLRGDLPVVLFYNYNGTFQVQHYVYTDSNAAFIASIKNPTLLAQELSFTQFIAAISNKVERSIYNAKLHAVTKTYKAQLKQLTIARKEVIAARNAACAAANISYLVL